VKTEKRPKTICNILEGREDRKKCLYEKSDMKPSRDESGNLVGYKIGRCGILILASVSSLLKGEKALDHTRVGEKRKGTVKMA